VVNYLVKFILWATIVDIRKIMIPFKKMMVTFKSSTHLHFQNLVLIGRCSPQNQIAGRTKFVSYFVPKIFRWRVKNGTFCIYREAFKITNYKNYKITIIFENMRRIRNMFRQKFC